MKKSFLIIAAITLLLCSCTSFGDLGKSYSNFEELKKDQESKGFVFLGKFGDTWPAEVKEVKIESNEISFELKSGREHRYSGYEGYELKMLRLSADNQEENVVILRSKEKK